MANNEALDLSVIIVNWNTRDELRVCLRSVFEADPGSMEVTVIDNASSDDSVHVLRDEFPLVHWIANSDNLGFARACNQGIEASRGRYILLVNPDSIIQPDAFTKILRFADDNPEIGIFGLKVLNPDGSLQYSCRRFPTLAAGIFRNTIIGHFFPKNPYTRDYLMTGWDHSAPRDVDWVSGCAMFIRRSLLDEIGLLDERFFMYCEDVDLGYRAHQKDWRVTYFPEAVVVHARARSSDKNPNRMIVEFHKSMYRFFKKHYYPESSIFVKIIVPLGLIARAGFFIGRNDFYYVRNCLRRLLNRRNNSSTLTNTAASRRKENAGGKD